MRGPKLRWQNLLVGPWLGCALWVVPASVRAEPTEKQLELARALFREAEEFEAQGEWQRALEDLEQIATIKVTPGVRFHLAYCKEQLGHVLDAYDDFERAHEQAILESNDDVRSLAGAALTRLDAVTARVWLNTPPTHVAVFLDGHALRGQRAVLLPGRHNVEATSVGAPPFRWVFDVSAGQTLALDVSPGGSERPRPAKTNGENSPSPTNAVRPGAWVTLGAGALLGVTGAVAFAIADRKQDDARETCARSAACDAERDATRTWDAIALGSFVGAIGLAATGAILLGIPSSTAGPPARTAAVTRGFRFVPMDRGVGVSGGFP